MSSDPNHRNMLERINSVFGSITNDVPYQFTKFYQKKLMRCVNPCGVNMKLHEISI